MLHTLSVCCALAVAVSSVLLPFSLFADAAKGSGNSALEASAKASLDWLSLVDRNKYAESWDQSSALTKLTVNKDEWITILEKTRKPLGSVSSRQVADQRTAKDPSGLPKGDYIVMFYKTAFSHKPAAFELVTLYLEDGQWRVLTYQVDGQ